MNHQDNPMTDQLRPDGRVTRGEPNDTLHADDPLMAAWLKRVMKPGVVQGDTVVLPREAMNGLVDMARNKGFTIDTQDG
jgi:hypothetical protein